MCNKKVWEKKDWTKHLKSTGHYRNSRYSRKLLRFNAVAGDWEHWDMDTDAPLTEASPSQSLTLVTFNVLFDLYPENAVYLELRHPRLLDLLQRLRADVIGLQEVTPPFSRLLMDQPWVQAEYCVTCPTAATPYGQMLLSRWPLTNVHTLRLSKSKTVLRAQLSVGGAAHDIAVVHLSSNWAEDMADRRQEQLQQAVHDLCSGPGAAKGGQILMGDFNFGEAETAQYGALLDGYTDVWTELKPSEPGFTYDLVHNWVARATMAGSDCECQRFDRILLRTPVLRPTNVQLVATAPVACDLPTANDGAAASSGKNGVSEHGGLLYLSDHYGVQCVCDIHCPPGNYEHQGGWEHV